MLYCVRVIALISLLMCTMVQLATAQVWEDVSKETQSKTSVTSNTRNSMEWARKLHTDLDGLKFILNQAPHEQLGGSDTLIDLPLPDGGLATFAVSFSPVLAPGFDQKRSDMQTFRVIETTNSSNTGRLDITPLGFHAMFMHDGALVFIDPTKNSNTYYSYFDNDYAAKEKSEGSEETTCTSETHAENKFFTPFDRKTVTGASARKISFGSSMRTYRIAVAATGEYTQYFGGTADAGLAGIVTAINRLNVIFESELAVRLELVANNISVVYTDPDTDPFTHTDTGELLNEIGGVLDAEIGNANYDIGHVFGVFGGGIARLAAVCGSGKARGASGSSRPDRSSFVRLLAHEVGHQFNAPHSFNGSTDNCGSSRSSSGAFEPHSGSTIMSYSGICGSENLSGGKDTFFHNSSLTFMNDFVENPSRGGSCPVLVTNSNAAPEVEAGKDGAIPISTPFMLTGQATDADGDALTHIWEQLDNGPRNDGVSDFEDDGQRPLFRSFQPLSSTSRTFPQLARILAGDRVLGEVLPTQDRTLTFRMTTRDNRGGVTDDERILQVSATAGPFTIETPAAQALTGGMIQTVNWDVANTTADPVNCDAVSLALSTDGGQTFSVELTPSTENDGSASVEIPNVSTSSARLKASCTTQPFFAINDANFTITQSVVVNEAPNPIDDNASVEEDSLRVEIDVLANDTDPEGDTLTLVSVGTPSANATLEIANGLVVYTPETGFTGTETFSYVVDDGNANTSSATVTVTVTAKPNTAPDAADDNLTVDQDSGATSIDVLANDRDADGDSLTIQSVGTPSQGGSAQTSSGQVSYTPSVDFNGTETFTYMVSDGETTSTGTVTVTVTAAPPPSAPVPPATVAESGGGGGSFGLVLLLLLAVRNRIANFRTKLRSVS